MSLEIGDSVKSGQDSKAEITFFDGSTIELEAGTQIEVALLDIAADSGSTTILIKQEIGKTISRVTRLTDPASRYEVETPNGIAAVRGSSMIVQVITGVTWVTNLEGEIWVTSNGVELQIPEGEKCIIKSSQNPRLMTGGSTGGGGRKSSANPDIAIIKTADLMLAHEGDTITYTYTVTNPGDVPLSDVSVGDNIVGEVTTYDGDTDGDGKLDTNETWVFTATYVITAEDLNPLVNNASASGTDAQSQTVIAWATASVEILRPAIAVTKTAEPTQVQKDDTITYTYTVSNDGDVTLYNVNVDDDRLGQIVLGHTTLAPGETTDGTATYEVTQADMDAGSIENVATATATDPNNNTVTDDDTHTVTLSPPHSY